MGLTVNSGTTDQVALFESTDQFADLALKDSGGTSYIRQSNGSLKLEADRANASASSVVQIAVDNTEVARFASGGDISFYDDTGTTQALFWDASAESLGIGTTSPSVPLTVNNNTDHSDVAIFHAGGGTPDRGLKISTFANTNTNAGVELDAQNATGAFKFSTGGSERLRIDSSGNVGIGINEFANAAA
jgi:hypothetical protein